MDWKIGLNKYQHSKFQCEPIKIFKVNGTIYGPTTRSFSRDIKPIIGLSSYLLSRNVHGHRDPWRMKLYTYIGNSSLLWKWKIFIWWGCMLRILQFSNSSSIQLDCNNQNQYTSNVLTLQCLLLYMQYSYSPKICINVIPQPRTCTYNVVWLWWNCLWYFVQVVYYAPTTFECTHECTHALIYFTLDSRPLLALKRGCACVGV